jgi:hypothetical protein
MSVAKQSFEFVRSFEPWQQDLFLRAAAAPTLSPDDERAALDLLLDDESCGKARRVTPDDFVQAPDAGEPLQLLGIENPTDVNALASGAVLRFDRASLNIVYGDNGAGKTGYSRILKHVGRALERENVLPDMLGDVAPSGRLRVGRGGEDDKYEIQLDEPGPALLGAISCYDCSCGDRYLTAANEIDYVPYAVEALRRLATAQGQLAARLDQQAKDAAPAPLDLRPYPEGTRVRELLETLGPGSPQAELVAAARLDDDELERRAQLRRSAAEIDARQAAQLRAKATAEAAAARRLRDDLEAAAKQLSPTAIATARQELDAVSAARDARDRHSTAKLFSMRLRARLRSICSGAMFSMRSRARLRSTRLGVMFLTRSLARLRSICSGAKFLTRLHTTQPPLIVREVVP